MGDEMLCTAINLYRLQKDLEFIDDEIKKNEPVSIGYNNFFKKTYNKVITNAVRRKKTDVFSDKRRKVLEEIEKISKDSEKLSGEEIKENLSELFNGDEMKKYFFALDYLVRDKSNYQNREKTLREVSWLIFGDNDELLSVQKKLNENFVKINGYDLSDKQRLEILAGGGLVFFILSSTAYGLTGILKFLGIALSLGAGHLASKEIKKIIVNKSEKESVESLRKLSPTELAVLFAIKATALEIAKTKTGEQDFKESLDECLRFSEELRSDAEYLCIVEKTDCTNTKNKMAVCHKLVNRLTEIVGV